MPTNSKYYSISKTHYFKNSNSHPKTIEKGQPTKQSMKNMTDPIANKLEQITNIDGSINKARPPATRPKEYSSTAADPPHYTERR